MHSWVYRTLLLSWCALLGNGCSGAHLYNQADDEIAKSAKSGYETVRLLTVVNTERQNLEKQLVEDIRIIDSNADLILKLELFSLANSTKSIKKALFNRRFLTERYEELGIYSSGASLHPLNTKRAGEMANARKQIRKLRSPLSLGADELVELGLRPPVCDGTVIPEYVEADVLNQIPKPKQDRLNPGDMVDLESAYNYFKEKCEDVFKKLGEALGSRDPAEEAAAEGEAAAAEEAAALEEPAAEGEAAAAEEAAALEEPAAEGEAPAAEEAALEEPAAEGEAVTAEEAAADGTDDTGPIGLVNLTYQAWLRDLEEIRMTQTAARTAEIDLNDAINAYQTAVKTNNPTDAKQAVDEAVEKMKTALKILDEVGGAIGVPSGAEKKIEALNTILVAAESGKVSDEALKDPENKGLENALSIAASIKTLAAKYDALTAALRQTPVSALIIEKERQLVLRDAARRRAEARRKRSQLIETRLLRVLDEVQFYRDIEKAKLRLLKAALEAKPGVKPDGFRIDTMNPNYVAVTKTDAGAECTIEFVNDNDAKVDGTLPSQDCPFLKSLHSLLDNSNKEFKEQTYLALNAYISAIAIAWAEQERIDFRLINLAHQGALDDDETAIRLWNAIIATPIEQLASYHASGFKAEELADMAFKLIGLIELGILAVKVD